MLDPSEVEQKSRKRVLKAPAEADLRGARAIAAEAGVGDLYDYAVGAFEGALQKKRTRTSIGFARRFANGSRKSRLSAPRPGREQQGGRLALPALQDAVRGADGADSRRG